MSLGTAVSLIEIDYRARGHRFSVARSLFPQGGSRLTITGPLAPLLPGYSHFPRKVLSRALRPIHAVELTRVFPPSSQPRETSVATTFSLPTFSPFSKTRRLSINLETRSRGKVVLCARRNKYYVEEVIRRWMDNVIGNKLSVTSIVINESVFTN